MQYLIQVNGDVTERQNKTYVVKSSSIEEAEKIAARNFCNTFNSELSTVSVFSKKRNFRVYISYVLLFIPIFLSMVDWKIGHETISIRPDLISCLFAIAFYLAFVVRFKGIERTVGTWVDSGYCILSVLLLASFIKIVSITETISVFGITEFTISSYLILFFSLILSWVGLKLVSLIGIGTIAVMAFYRITVLSQAMGYIWGPVYIISSLMGIMLYLSVEPAYTETVTALKLSAAKISRRMNSDLVVAKAQGKSLKSATEKAITENIKKKEK